MTTKETQALHQTAYFAIRQEEIDAAQYLQWAIKDNDEKRIAAARKAIADVTARRELHGRLGWPDDKE